MCRKLVSLSLKRIILLDIECRCKTKDNILVCQPQPYRISTKCLVYRENCKWRSHTSFSSVDSVIMKQLLTFSFVVRLDNFQFVILKRSVTTRRLMWLNILLGVQQKRLYIFNDIDLQETVMPFHFKNSGIVLVTE